MSGLIAIHRRTSRRTICVGPWAIKVARNAAGLRCNRLEAECWERNQTNPTRRAMLCPVLMAFPLGIALVMERAEPLSDHEAGDYLQRTRDWDYAGPGDQECPFEPKASDWGRLDGRLVALDYSGDPGDDEQLVERVAHKSKGRTMVDRIDTYTEFKRSIVEPDFRDFLADRGDLRKAWHCAGSLFHLPRLGVRSTQGITRRQVQVC